MTIKKIADEMIYMGGGNWVLERQLAVDGKIKYCRLSDDMFVYGDLPIQFITDENLSVDEDYWYDTESDEITIYGLRETLDDMLTEYRKEMAKDNRILVGTRLSKLETIYGDNRTVIFKEILEMMETGWELISTEVVGWYYGKPDATHTAAYIGKLKAEY